MWTCILAAVDVAAGGSTSKLSPCALLLVAVGCSRRAPPGDAPREVSAPLVAATPDPIALPDAVVGFAAGPLVSTADYARRSYTNAHAQVTVTLGYVPMSARAYAGWVEQSRAYPQAALGVSPEEGNGFYQCAGDGGAGCALLVQLRGGAHLEIRGDTATTQDDVDALAAGLPLHALAAAIGPLPSSR